MNEKVAQGGWPNKAPIGYLNVSGRIEVDRATAPLVRRAFEYYSSGEFSLEALSERLCREGLVGRRHGQKLTKSFLRDQVLSNPFYCGLLRYRGTVHPAAHEPIITAALFQAVQGRLEGRSQPKSYRHRFRYGGLPVLGMHLRRRRRG